jgi:hypothetical protein
MDWLTIAVVILLLWIAVILRGIAGSLDSSAQGIWRTHDEVERVADGITSLRATLQDNK